MVCVFAWELRRYRVVKGGAVQPLNVHMKISGDTFPIISSSEVAGFIVVIVEGVEPKSTSSMVLSMTDIIVRRRRSRKPGQGVQAVRQGKTHEKAHAATPLVVRSLAVWQGISLAPYHHSSCRNVLVHGQQLAGCRRDEDDVYTRLGLKGFPGERVLHGPQGRLDSAFNGPNMADDMAIGQTRRGHAVDE